MEKKKKNGVHESKTSVVQLTLLKFAYLRLMLLDIFSFKSKISGERTFQLLGEKRETQIGQREGFGNGMPLGLISL